MYLQRWSKLLFYIVIWSMVGIFLLFIGSWIAMCWLNSLRKDVDNNNNRSHIDNQDTNDLLYNTLHGKHWSNEQPECPVQITRHFPEVNCHEMVEVTDIDDAFPTPPPSSHWETIDLNQETYSKI